MIMEIINRNFFHILSCGAFGSDGDIEPMSLFKWQQTIAIARALGVVSYLAKGIVSHEGERNMNVTGDLLNEMRREAAAANNNVTMVSVHVKDKYPMPHLANAINNIKLRRIVYGEYHSIDTSVATLNLLEIIIKNINGIMSKGVDIYGIIQLGLFLRQKGHNVDFVKTEEWIGRLGIKKMANLIGNMLILQFGFEDDEIPFVHSRDNNAAVIMKHYMDCIKTDMGLKLAKDNNNPENNDDMLKNVGSNAMRYFGYMPVEAVCKTVTNFTRKLSEIEE